MTTLNQLLTQRAVVERLREGAKDEFGKPAKVYDPVYQEVPCRFSRLMNRPIGQWDASEQDTERATNEYMVYFPPGYDLQIADVIRTITTTDGEVIERDLDIRNWRKFQGRDGKVHHLEILVRRVYT